MKNPFGFNFDNTYVHLPEILFTRLNPTPVADPKLVIFNHELSAHLGLNLSQCDEHDLAALFSGNQLAQGSTPLAQAYAGHQFGNFAILGDGRAHLLAEHIDPCGQRFDIQLKGSGPSPYSRRGDGRAALGPMLREYLISEAMHALGISTTRSLAVITTGENVYRTTLLPGAILTRIATSHLRVGTFEFAAFRQDKEVIQALLDYSLKRHDPDLIESINPALAFLERVIHRQVDLIIHWLRVGFIHGVMNTDNMTISGETIDYGPCAFMDHYDPKTVFSSIDESGRYAFGNQAVIAQWNLVRLAEALLPLIDSDMAKAIELATHSLNQFSSYYQTQWQKMMKNKLGLLSEQENDIDLIHDLLDRMARTKADYTNTFLALMQYIEDDASDKTQLLKLQMNHELMQWVEIWRARIASESEDRSTSLAVMQKMNPCVIPRNHQVEIALEAANAGDMAPFRTLLNVLSDPYHYRDELKPYQSAVEESGYRYKTYCGT